MAENLDLNNLFLDDNDFTTVPEGDYRFEVTDYELGYATSAKMPENTQVITVHMRVPYKSEDGIVNVSVRLNLNVYSKALFAIRQFFESIGLMPEKGRAKMPQLDLMIGKTGICRLLQGVSAKGNEYNQVDICYPPSKAPTVTNNDDAWNAKTLPEGFKVDESEVNPFV